MEKIRACPTFNDQYDLRKEAILGLPVPARPPAGRAGRHRHPGAGRRSPSSGGTYRVNDAMVEQTRSGKYGNHVCNLGSRVALDLCRESGRPSP